MAIDFLTLALAKAFTKKTADALGAVKGAPCTIKSIEEITGGHRITFEWTGDSGAKQTQSFDVMDGEGGKADSVEWSKVTNKPDFATVATSGSYNDLNDKPTIPPSYDDTALSERVTANTTAIADRYTKTETDGKIAEAMTDVDNEHFHPVTTLPSPTDEDPAKRPKENHEYILIEYEQDGTTIKSETHYLFYGGAYHQKSTGGISLEGYATEDFVNTKTANMGEFDVTPIPQGPTGANEINAVLSNKDNEYARLSYVRQSDGTLPSTVNLGVKSGLGEDSFELPTRAYVNSKTLTPTGWGVARTGVATVTFNNNRWSTSATVDISDLGFASGSDYDVVVQPTTGGTATPWGNAIAFVNANKGASSFSVSSVTMEESLSGTVNVKYTIFAKGYGGTHFVDGTGLPTGGVTGQVLAKRSDTDGDVLWKNANTDSTSVNKANLQGRMVGVYTDDIGGDTTKRFMVMNDSTNKEVAVSFRNAEAELNETAQLYHKDAVDALLENKQDTLESEVNIKTVKGNSLLGAGDLVVGNDFEVGAEKWYGTYTENGVTYQVYSKLLNIGALPSAAGTKQYPHGITDIKQILQISGFTNDGFVMNAARQNAQDNISVYQAQKSGNIAVEVGKDRSSKTGFVMLIYAKNN